MSNKFFGDGFTLRVFTIMLFLLLSIAGIGFSIYMFTIATTTYMYILSLAFFVLSAVSSFFNISASIMYYRSYFYVNHLKSIQQGLKPITKYPKVAAVVPVYNEEPAVVEETLESISTLNYPKAKLVRYLLDDSTETAICSELEAYCASNGVRYIHRDNRNGYKAGALNNMLKGANEEFIAIFDFDEHIVDRNFLVDLLPYFSNKSMSYVQTEKTRTGGGLLSETINLFDAFFFKFIEPARALNNTAIFAGSCGLIRRSILDKLGGFPEYVIEDTFFSFESDRSNYKSLYVPKVYAVGKPLRTFTELAKQQWRYNYGDTQFIGYFFKRTNGLRKSPLMRMDYITHGMGLNYISIVLIMFTVVSMLIVFSSLVFAHLTLTQVVTATSMRFYAEMAGAAALVLSIFTPIILAKIYFNSAKKGVMLFALNYALAFIRTKAAIAALLHMNPMVKWNRNNALKGSRLLASIVSTKVELAFSSIVLLFGLLAAATQNVLGGIWLMGYGIMYLLTTAFIYKYG